MERYYFVILNEGVTVDDSGNRLKFPTEQEAAESAWQAIKDGYFVRTANNINNNQTRWKYDYHTGGIIGETW